MAYSLEGGYLDALTLPRDNSHKSEDRRYLWNKPDQMLSEEREVYIYKIKELREKAYTLNRSMVVVALLGDAATEAHQMNRIIDEGVALTTCNHPHAIMHVLNFSNASATLWELRQQTIITRLTALKLDCILLALTDKPLAMLAGAGSVAANHVLQELEVTVRGLSRAFPHNRPMVMHSKPKIITYLPRQGK